jgi:actin-like ATPase involved in cell morphogenesis
MREAAIKAGLVQHVKAGDTMDRLHIITEPEAAAHCALATDINHPRPAQNFMIIDAGGGTCDLTVRKPTSAISLH